MVKKPGKTIGNLLAEIDVYLQEELAEEVSREES